MNQTMEKRFSKFPLKSFLLYLCIALFLTTGVTFSRYIASSNGGDAARVTKFGELSLYETVDGTRVNSQELVYAPGVSITKNPMVDFKGNELAAYVFIKINAQNWTFDSTDNSFSILNGNKGPTEILKWYINTSEWTALSNDNEIVYYIYVPAGTELNEISIITDNAIAVSDNITNGEMTEIQSIIGNVTFTSYAVQANGFENAVAAWDSVSEK